PRRVAHRRFGASPSRYENVPDLRFGDALASVGRDSVAPFLRRHPNNVVGAVPQRASRPVRSFGTIARIFASLMWVRAMRWRCLRLSTQRQCGSPPQSPNSTAPAQLLQTITPPVITGSSMLRV